MDIQFSLTYKLAGEEICQRIEKQYFGTNLTWKQWSERSAGQGRRKSFRHFENCHDTARGQFLHDPFVLTARQYGEVVLPDAIPADLLSWFFGKRFLSAGKGGDGALFAVMVQILLSITRVAVQVWSEPRIYPRLQSWRRALAQCRGTNYLEGSNLSRCRIKIACRCACPGVGTITKLSWVQKQKQKAWQTTYPYCPCYRQCFYFIHITSIHMSFNCRFGILSSRWED